MRFLYFLRSDISEMYVGIALRTFFVSMISIFLPIFLFTHGLNLLDIAFFYIMKALFGIPIVIFTQWALKRVSFAKSMFISAMAYLSFLYLLNLDLNFLPLIALFSEFSDVTFWVPFHYLFAHLTGKKSEGKSFGISRALLSFAPLVSPLLGAYLIVNFGYHVLFAIASFGLILSVVPIALIKKHIRIKRPFRNVFTLSIRYFLEGIRIDGVFVYWPILLYLVVLNISQIGLISSVSSFIGGISMLIVGRYIGTKFHTVVKKIGGYGHGLSLFLRAFISDFYSALSALSIGMVFNSMLISPFLVEFYEEFRKKDYFLLTREINIRYGRIFVGLVLVVLALMLDDPLRWLMVFLSPVSALMSLV